MNWITHHVFAQAARKYPLPATRPQISITSPEALGYDMQVTGHPTEKYKRGTNCRLNVTIIDTRIGVSAVEPDSHCLCHVLCSNTLAGHTSGASVNFQGGQTDSEGRISLLVNDLIPFMFDRHLISEMGHTFRVQIRVEVDPGQWVEWISKDIAVEE